MISKTFNDLDFFYFDVKFCSLFNSSTMMSHASSGGGLRRRYFTDWLIKSLVFGANTNLQLLPARYQLFFKTTFEKHGLAFEGI